MSPTPLTQSRQAEYHDAWRVTGEIAAHPHVKKYLERMLSTYPAYWYPWIQILNKLIRALVSPGKIDHWDDIIGYATLVRDQIHPGGAL